MTSKKNISTSSHKAVIIDFINYSELLSAPVKFSCHLQGFVFVFWILQPEPHRLLLHFCLKNSYLKKTTNHHQQKQNKTKKLSLLFEGNVWSSVSLLSFCFLWSTVWRKWVLRKYLDNLALSRLCCLHRQYSIFTWVKMKYTKFTWLVSRGWACFSLCQLPLDLHRAEKVWVITYLMEMSGPACFRV